MSYGNRQPLAGKKAVYSLGAMDKMRTWWRVWRGSQPAGGENLGEFVVMKRRG